MKAKLRSGFLLVLAITCLHVNAQEPAGTQPNQIAVTIILGWAGKKQQTLAAGATVFDAIVGIDEKTLDRGDFTLDHVRLCRKNTDGQSTTRTIIDLVEQRKDPSKATALQAGDILEFRPHSSMPPL